MSTLRFDLPWPHKDLSPNARVHWAAKASRTRSARRDAYLETREAKLACVPQFVTADKVSVHMAFCPPDKRKRDGHNLASAMKGAIDGIADALGIDDSHFIVSHELIEYGMGISGKVLITIKDAK